MKDDKDKNKFNFGDWLKERDIDLTPEEIAKTCEEILEMLNNEDQD